MVDIGVGGIICFMHILCFNSLLMKHWLGGWVGRRSAPIPSNHSKIWHETIHYKPNTHIYKSKNCECVSLNCVSTCPDWFSINSSSSELDINAFLLMNLVLGIDIGPKRSMQLQPIGSGLPLAGKLAGNRPIRMCHVAASRPVGIGTRRTGRLLPFPW